MNAFVLHDTSDRTGVFRWSTSAAAMVAVHTGLIALGLAWYTQRPPPGVTMPAIMVDMAPASSAPRPTPIDLAPGPQMQQADASPPPESTTHELVQEQIAPTPPQQRPDVEAPPEQKMLPTPPKPEPAKIVPDRPKPVPVKPRPVRAEAKKPSETTPAPRATATPRAEREAPAA
jgi:periplasmic protein TonB